MIGKPASESLTPCAVVQQLLSIAFGLALSLGVGFGLLDPESMSEFELGLTFAGLAFAGIGVARWALRKWMPCKEQ